MGSITEAVAEVKMSQNIEQNIEQSNQQDSTFTKQFCRDKIVLASSTVFPTSDVM